MSLLAYISLFILYLTVVWSYPCTISTRILKTNKRIYWNKLQVASVITELNVTNSYNYGAKDYLNQLNKLIAQQVQLNEADKQKYFQLLLDNLNILTDKQLLNCLHCLGSLKIPYDLINNCNKLVNRIDIIANNSKPIDLHKLVNGLTKMGFRYTTLSNTTRDKYINLSNTYINGESIINPRELSTYLYSLGQLECDLSILSLNISLNLLENCLLESSAQGISNALHGIARIGTRWIDINDQLKSLIDNAITNKMNQLKHYELSSILQSLAIMKCNWNNLSSEFKLSFDECLSNLLSTMSHREISNILWSLGQLNLSIDSKEPKEMVDKVINRLIEVFPQLTMFDLESMFVGLGLIQVPFSALSINNQLQLLNKVKQSVNRMNIFCLYNVLWGLARMNAILGDELASQILQKTLDIFHTFLSSQYGDILWSLGSLGYESYLSRTSDRSRILAVLSRVFPSLPVRSGVYTLWGLGKLGFLWNDMEYGYSSIEGGRQAPPLNSSIIKYLRQRVSSMKEHEYAVMLYALGELSVPFQSLGNVTDKIHHRLTRLSTFLTPRSTTNGLYGLGKCNVLWISLPSLTKDGWIQAIDRNLEFMNPFEISQMLYSIGRLQVPWMDFPEILQSRILNALNHTYGNMTSMGCSISLWGLSISGCPKNEIPKYFIEKVIDDLVELVYKVGNQIHSNKESEINNKNLFERDNNINSRLDKKLDSEIDESKQRLKTSLAALKKINIEIPNEIKVQIQRINENESVE